LTETNNHIIVCPVQINLIRS